MDAYNANPSSMSAAIDNLAKLGGRKIALLGDMLELGKDTQNEHRAVLEMADRKALDLILLVGENFAAAAEAGTFTTAIRVFKNRNETQEYLQSNPQKGFTILVKASHSIALESLRDVFQ